MSITILSWKDHVIIGIHFIRSTIAQTIDPFGKMCTLSVWGHSCLFEEVYFSSVVLDRYRFVQGYLNSVRSKVMKREGKEFVHWMFCELSDGTIDTKFSFNVSL